jgi:hypothetical protein
MSNFTRQDDARLCETCLRECDNAVDERHHLPHGRVEGLQPPPARQRAPAAGTLRGGRGAPEVRQKSESNPRACSQTRVTQTQQGGAEGAQHPDGRVAAERAALRGRLVGVRLLVVQLRGRRVRLQWERGEGVGERGGALANVAALHRMQPA